MSNIINTVIVALQGYDGLPFPQPPIETLPGLPASNTLKANEVAPGVGVLEQFPEESSPSTVPSGNLIPGGQYQPGGVPVNVFQNNVILQSFGTPISF